MTMTVICQQKPQRLNSMTRILYFLSKTDVKVLHHCPASAKNIQASMGFFVLLTGLMAFISGSYAFSNMFVFEKELTGKPEMMTAGWLYAMALGLVYATFIMAIDREIVSSSTKWIAVLRIPLAIIISMIVAIPVEMQLFEGRINKHLKDKYKKEKEAFFTITRNNNNVYAEQKSIDSLEKDKRRAIRDRDYFAKLMLEEQGGKTEIGITGKAGPGRVYKEAELNEKKQETQIQLYEEELAKKREILDIATKKADSVYKYEKDGGAFDLLSKYIALHEVEQVDTTGSARKMGWGITILFCLFEIIPALMKVFLPRTEYDVLLDKRRLLNIKSTISIFEQAKLDYEDKLIEEIATLNPIIIEKMLQSQAI